MKRQPKRNATMQVPSMVAALTAPLWLAPALLVNVDWSAGILAPWNVAAAASIAAAALFAAKAIQARTRAAVAVFAISATLLTANNVVIAFTSASHRSADGRDHRQSEIATITRLEIMKRRLVESRRAAVAVASEKPTATLQLEVDQAIAANARRWRATDHCAPESVTVAPSMAFCAQVAALRGQLAAARQRDGLDAQIEALDKQASAVAAPESADPFSDAIADLAAMVGFPLSKAAVEALPAVRDGLRALTLELIAALGPAAWLTMWHRPAPKRPTARPVPARSVRREGLAEAVGANVVAFCRDRVDRDPESSARAGDVWAAYKEWCRSRAIDPGSQKRFGRSMAQHFTRDRNHGRPQYMGAKLKAAPVRSVVPFRKSAAG